MSGDALGADRRSGRGVRLLRGAAAAVTRRYPFCRGMYAVSHLRPLRRLTARDEVVDARLSDGSIIELRMRDMVGRTVLYCGDHDPRLTWICRRILRPGDCCVDLGANVGAVALRAARLVGAEGVVHAVEPQPDLAAGLCRAAAANGYHQLRVHQLALSDHDGTMPLRLPPSGDRGVATLEQRAEEWSAVSVPVRHAGAFLAGLALARIRLLKVDVEGHEETILRAAHEFIAAHPPDVIAFESFYDQHAPFWQRPVVQAFAGLGYRFFELPAVLLRVRLTPLTEPTEPQGRGWDFVAVSPDAGGAEALHRLGLD